MCIVILPADTGELVERLRDVDQVGDDQAGAVDVNVERRIDMVELCEDARRMLRALCAARWIASKHKPTSKQKPTRTLAAMGGSHRTASSRPSDGADEDDGQDGASRIGPGGAVEREGQRQRAGCPRRGGGRTSRPSCRSSDSRSAYRTTEAVVGRGPVEDPEPGPRERRGRWDPRPPARARFDGVRGPLSPVLRRAPCTPWPSPRDGRRGAGTSASTWSDSRHCASTGSLRTSRPRQGKGPSHVR